MGDKLSKRLADVVNALPLKKGMRVLEIGCGPGAMAREIAKRIGSGYILAVDRSEKAIRQAIAGSKTEMGAGNLRFLHCPIEQLELGAAEKPFDIAVAIRVGALDGRHPECMDPALFSIAKALTKEGKLYVDGGDPLKEVPLEGYRDAVIR